MSEDNSAAITAMAIICALSVLLAGLMKFRPPRHINWLYGYRTSRSMRTPATWHEANRYFANYFWRLTWVLPILAASAYLTVGGMPSILILLTGWILGLVIGLVLTENRLKKLFYAGGNPRD
jgi:uncharacterized membrane protein